MKLQQLAKFWNSRRGKNLSIQFQDVLYSCNIQDSVVLLKTETQINEKEREPSNSPMQYGQFIFDKAAKAIQLKNNSLFKNCAIVIGYP